MEKEINELYRGTMRDAFDEYFGRGDIQGCREVISKLYDDGFDLDAKDLESQMLNAPLSKFLNEFRLPSWA